MITSGSGLCLTGSATLLYVHFPQEREGSGLYIYLDFLFHNLTRVLVSTFLHSKRYHCLAIAATSIWTCLTANFAFLSFPPLFDLWVLVLNASRPPPASSSFFLLPPSLLPRLLLHPNSYSTQIANPLK